MCVYRRNTGVYFSCTWPSDLTSCHSNEWSISTCSSANQGQDKFWAFWPIDDVSSNLPSSLDYNDYPPRPPSYQHLLQTFPWDWHCREPLSPFLFLQPRDITERIRALSSWAPSVPAEHATEAMKSETCENHPSLGKAGPRARWCALFRWRNLSEENCIRPALHTIRLETHLESRGNDGRWWQ